MGLASLLTFWFVQRVQRNTRAWCQADYAKAHSAVDSARVDSERFTSATRSGFQTCASLRASR
jgi:hypothetical protein